MKIFGRIGLFFVTTFILTIILVIAQQAMGINSETISLPQFGPGLAAMVMMLLFRSDNVSISIKPRGIHIKKYLAALGIPLIVPVILFLAYNQVLGDLAAPAIDGVAFTVMLFGILLGAFGEELGWRGYGQNLLDRNINGIVAFLVIGVLWGIWHVGNFQYGPIYMLFFVFSTIGYSAVLAWLLQGTNYNVVLATLFHFGVNVGFFILRNALTDIRLVIMNGLVWLAIAVIITTFKAREFVKQTENYMSGNPNNR